MTIKTNFNQGLVNKSNIKLLISQITQRLKFISEKGDHFAKINKKMPNVEMAVKSIFLKPNSKVLILNSGVGVLGLVFASINQRTKFFLYDSNIQNVKLLKRI